MDARTWFEEVSVKYTKLKGRMDARYTFVVDPVFEDKVAAIPDDKKMFLRPIKERSVQHAKDSDIDEQPRSQLQDLSFAKWLLAKSEQEVDRSHSKYVDLQSLLPIPNLCERLFFSTGFTVYDL